MPSKKLCVCVYMCVCVSVCVCVCVCVYKMVLKITKEAWGKCGIKTVKHYT